MKRFIAMILLSAAKGACADSGVNQPSIYEVPCTGNGCSKKTGCIIDGSSQVVWPLLYDCDGTGSTKSNFGVNALTPVSGSCSTTGYVLSSTPYTYTPHPQDSGVGCDPTNAAVKFCLRYGTTTQIIYYNAVQFSVQFYYCAVFNDGSKYCHPQAAGITVICPAGPLQYTTTVPSTDFIFQQNDLKVIDFPSQIQSFFQSTNACPGVVMTSYGVYTDSALTTLFADDATYQLANTEESILTKMTISSTTPLNFKTFYVIAASKGFAKTQSQVLAINIYICGFESIAYTTTPAPISANLTPGTGVQIIDHSLQSGLLSTSFASCPIQNYEVITNQATGALLVGTSVIADATNLQVDTSQAISGPLWLRVSTSSRVGYYDIPLNINLCGSETIQFSPSAPVAITQTYDKGTGSHTLDYTTQTNLLSSSDSACPIQTFDITTDQAGSLYTGSQVSLASNLITTDTSTAFNTPLFIRALTVGGASYYIPLNIFVCGFETIVASTIPTGIVQVYANGIGIKYLDHTTQTSLLSSSHPECPIQSRDIITDQAQGTSLGGSPVTVDATNIITDTSVGFNTPLWLRCFTSSGVYYDIPLTIKVCGFQTIIGAATDIQLYYGANTGTQTFDHTVSSGLLSTDSPACPIQTFQIIDQATGNLLGDSSVIANWNNIVTDTTSGTNKSLFLRAVSSGNVYRDIPLNINYCGSESIIVSGTISPIEVTYQRYSVTESLSHTSMSSMLSSSLTQCPINKYEIITDTTSGALLGGTQITLDASMNNIITLTTTAFNTPLWIRVTTLGGVSYDIPLNIFVCGFETISASSSTQALYSTYQRLSSTEVLAHTLETNKLSSSHAGCPIQSRDIITDQTSGTSLGGSPVSFDATNIITDTSASFNTPLWLRTFTSGGSFYDIPLNIFVCGFETISASSAPPGLTATYAKGIGLQYLDYTAQTNLLSSSHADCPIVSNVEIIDQTTGTLLGGTPISHDTTNIITDTASTFNTPLWLRSYTNGGAFYDIPLNIYVCGFEQILGTPTDIILVYQLDSGQYSHDHTTSSSLLISDFSGCPITSFEIIDKLTMAPIADTSVVTDISIIQIDSTAASNKDLFLRAITSGGVYRDIPLQIYFCGLESILLSSTISPIAVTYPKDSQSYTLSHTSMSSLLSSSIVQCPINKFEIVTDIITGALLGGSQITADMSNIYTQATTAFNTPIWLRATTKGGISYDIPLDFIVCGFETIQASSPTSSFDITYQRLSITELLDHRIQTSHLSSSIARCPIQRYDIITDQASGASLGGTLISVDSNNVMTQTSSPFNTPLWLRTFTIGEVFYDIPLNIYICGFETIVASSNPSALGTTYQKGIGSQSLDHTPQTNLLSSSHAGCPIQSYDVITEQTLGTPLGGTPVSIDSTNIITDTIAPFNTPLWLRTFTSGGAFYDIPLNIYVCGFETIVASATPVISITYNKGIGTQTLDHTAQTGLLSSSHALCPITVSEIITDTALGTLLGGTPISHDATNIQTDTTNSFNTPIWLRTYTSGGNFYDFPLQIYVCGFETILVPGATPTSIEITYQRNSVIEQLDHTSQTSLLTSSFAGCPIQSFDIITDQDFGTSLGGSPITVDSTNIITQTFTAFNTPLWLRTFTSGGAFYDIPLNIYICGFETVTFTTEPSTIEITYQRDSVTQTFDHAPKTSLLSSSHAGCPIQSYDIITDQNAGTSLGGSPISVDSPNTNIVSQTTSTFNTPLWLRTFTSGGAFYDIPLNIYICGFETISASSLITPISATYQKNTGIYSVDHTAQTNLLSSSWPDCPIVADKVFVLSTTSTVLTGTQFTADASNIITDSINAFDQPLSLRIFTSGGSYFDIPLDIVVCDDALIGSVDSSVIIQETYALNSGIKSYDVTQIQEAIRPTTYRCPLVLYDIVDNNFVHYENTKLSLVANLIQTDTSVAVNYERFFLRAYMDGSTIEKHIPIDFHYCGAEDVQVQNGEAQMEIVFVKGTGVQIYELSELMSKLVSTDPKCPVFSYQLYDQDKTGPYSGVQNVKLANNQLQLDTLSDFNLTLQLRASTQFGTNPNFAKITIIGCGSESFVSKLPSELSLIYQTASRVEEYSLKDVKQNLWSAVSKCPIKGYTLISDPEKGKPYNGQELSLENDLIRIDVSKSAQTTVYLQATTLGNQKFYVPIALKIWENSNGITVDNPPKFVKSPQQIVQISNYSGKFVIPDIKDDYDQFYCIQITSQTLGSPSEFKNMTLLMSVNGTKEDTLPELKGKNLRKIIDYNHFTKEIKINVPDDLQHLYTGFHSLNIRLIDIKGLSQDYNFVINFADEQQVQVAQKKIVNVTNFESKPQKVKAKITDIDYFGNMTIMFSTPMKTNIINITHINSSICDIYVEPEGNWHKNIDGFNISRLNLTWNVTGYERDRMNISLKFNNPVDISPKIDQDRIVFHILDLQHFFISETLLMDLSEEYHTLKYPIRKQMIPSEYAKQFIDSAQVASDALLLSQPVLFVLNFFMVFLLSHVFGMINSLQIIVHIILVSVIFPANVVTLLAIMIPVVQFDIFEEVKIPTIWFEESDSIDYDGLSPVNIMNQLQNLNYETHNPILNLGSIGVFIAIYVIRLVFLFLVLKPISQRHPKYQRYYINQYNIMIFGEIATLIFEGLFELMISVYLTFLVTESENFERTKFLAYLTIAIIILIVIIVIPIALTWLFFQDLKIIQGIQTLKVFQLGVSTSQKKFILFYLWFYLRRFLYLCICIFIKDHSFLQAQLFSILNLFMVCFQAKYKPLTTPRKNYTELFNELIIYLCFIHLFLFTDFVPEELTQYNIGWFFDFLVCLYVFFHVISLFYRIFEFIQIYAIHKDIINKIKNIIKSWVSKLTEIMNSPRNLDEQENNEELQQNKIEQDQIESNSGPPIRRMNCQKNIQFPDFDISHMNKYKFKKRNNKVKFKAKKKFKRRKPSSRVNPSMIQNEEIKQGDIEYGKEVEVEEEKVELQQNKDEGPTEEDYRRYDWFQQRERERLYGVTQEMEDKAFQELLDHMNKQWEIEYPKRRAEIELQKQRQQYRY